MMHVLCVFSCFWEVLAARGLVSGRGEEGLIWLSLPPEEAC
jgi:hypothetical protein